MKITKLAYHRNGISGAPFHVGIARKYGRRFVLITFDGAPETKRTAVLDIDLLAKETTAFGQNSWHGDDFHDAMMDAIDKACKCAEELKAKIDGE